jgi:hypothetical protein
MAKIFPFATYAFSKKLSKVITSNYDSLSQPWACKSEKGVI